VAGIDDRAADLGRTLETFIGFLRRRRDHHGGLPIAGSRAEHEIATSVASVGRAAGRSPATYAFPMALRALIAAEDHALSVRELLSSEESMLGTLVACRAAIEASGRAFYLLDPTIDARERIRRNLAERVVSARELARAEGWMMFISPDVMLANATSDATDLGFSLTSRVTSQADVRVKQELASKFSSIAAFRPASIASYPR
jgi:hypothetical protein